MPNTSELTYVSFPIEKFDKTEDGDLVVYGKATDGSVDSDQQIVDPDWSAKALQAWLDTGGNVRVQHQANRDPAGKGLQVEITPDGHYVKALVVEPIAKRLVEKGVLTAYSVGVMRPVIERDPTGKARGGIIRGGELAELSLVDRPANKNCGIVVAKSEDGSTATLVSEVFGEPEYLAKLATPSPTDVAKMVTKRRTPDYQTARDGNYSDPVVDSLAAVFKGADPETVKRQMDPNVGGGVDRDKLDESDFAGRDRSFPIVTPGDVGDAASSIGRAGPDNYSSDQLKQRIVAIARRKGPSFMAELPESWKNDGTTEIPSGGLATASKGAKDCPNCGKTFHADSKLRNCDDCGSDLPHADKTTDAEITKSDCPTCDGSGTIRDGNVTCPDCGGSDVVDDESVKTASAPKEAKPVCTKCGVKMKKSAAFCSSCGTPRSGDEIDKAKSPDAKDKDTDPAGAHREPDGMEDDDESTPTRQDKGASPGDFAKNKDTDPTPGYRDPGVECDFEDDADLSKEGWNKSVDYTVARLHDVLCAAYSADVVFDAYPALKTVSDAINLQLCNDDVAALMQLGDLAGASEAVMLASVAKAIVSAHPEAVADARAGLHKLFADMYPGPGNAVTPTNMSPGKFRRPYLSAGHAPLSAQPAGSSPPAAQTHTVEAENYSRGPLTSGHQSPSPGNKANNYAADQVLIVQNAMKELHDHITSRHQYLCPMDLATNDKPVTVGSGDAGVVNQMYTKSNTSNSAYQPESRPFVAVDAVEKMQKELGDRLETALAERDKAIADLRKQIDDMASQPDPNFAPFRGIVANKSNAGGAGAVDRRSLIDEARETEFVSKLAFVRELTKSGNPVLADQARIEEERLLKLASQ